MYPRATIPVEITLVETTQVATIPAVTTLAVTTLANTGGNNTGGNNTGGNNTSGNNTGGNYTSPCGSNINYTSVYAYSPYMVMENQSLQPQCMSLVKFIMQTWF